MVVVTCSLFRRSSRPTLTIIFQLSCCNSKKSVRQSQAKRTCVSFVTLLAVLLAANDAKDAVGCNGFGAAERGGQWACKYLGMQVSQACKYLRHASISGMQVSNPVSGLIHGPIQILTSFASKFHARMTFLLSILKSLLIGSTDMVRMQSFAAV